MGGGRTIPGSAGAYFDLGPREELEPAIYKASALPARLSLCSDPWCLPLSH